MYIVEKIATIYNNYIEKFGVPRQSGLAEGEISTIVFDKKYRDDNSLRGLEGYSHLWLIFVFSENKQSDTWLPTVRPPRLGGNKRMGVFATRSPYHPNNLGLSCVKIQSIQKTKNDGIVIKVLGADLMNGTPIVDIKPYVAFCDSHEDALCGFSDEVKNYKVDVAFSEELKTVYDMDFLCRISEILTQDPTPSYINDTDRIYGLSYDKYNIKFKKSNGEIFVLEIKE